uniref:Uncharacterized protein n=1 Tax=Candidatus Kentrum sp. SD TaxID=2126332 RepID=A0A451BR89_9GAMM|nr:MAG: hypothetical protein BECKSD772D_GA0070982_11493 [Candidatus Kentron sp. SD]
MRAWRWLQDSFNNKAIKTAFDTVLQKMPFLISLTPKERKSMFKADPDSVSFVQNTLNAAQDHPDILPATFKTGEFKNDVPPCATFCVIC